MHHPGGIWIFRRGTTLQIQEGAYLQYFCGYKVYDGSKPPFDPSLMVYFRKRLTPEILGEINEMILAAQQEAEEDCDDGDDINGGTIIVDATYAPAQIKYPQDTALLNEARENIEDFIDAMHTPGQKKPRTYRKRVRNHSVSDRIVSLSQPWLRPIVRGKAGAAVERCIEPHRALSSPGAGG